MKIHLHKTLRELHREELLHHFLLLKNCIHTSFEPIETTLILAAELTDHPERLRQRLSSCTRRLFIVQVISTQRIIVSELIIGIIICISEWEIKATSFIVTHEEPVPQMTLIDFHGLCCVAAREQRINENKPSIGAPITYLVLVSTAHPLSTDICSEYNFARFRSFSCSCTSISGNRSCDWRPSCKNRASLSFTLVIIVKPGLPSRMRRQPARISRFSVRCDGGDDRK